MTESRYSIDFGADFTVFEFESEAQKGTSKKLFTHYCLTLDIEEPENNYNIKISD
jgi:hypothetical protein